MKSNNGPQPITRRNALRGVATAAIGLNSIGIVGGLGDDTVKIVTEKGRPGEQGATKPVPRSWYEYEQQVDVALERAREKYEDQTGIRSIHLIPSSEARGGMRVSQLEFGVKPGSVGKNAHTPNKIGGIPVNKAAVGKLVPDAGCHFRGGGDQVFGGVSIETEIKNGTYNYGTNTCRVEVDGRPCVLTADHIWGGCENNLREAVYQGTDSPGSRKYIAEVYEQSDTYDWLVAEKDNHYGFRDYIRCPCSGNLRLASNFTRAGVKHLMNNAIQVWKQGVSTDRETGHIYRMDYHVYGYGCVDFYGGIETACNTAPGDSGGPVYAESSLSYGDVSMVSTHVAHENTKYTGRHVCGSKYYSAELGSPSYKMAEEFGIDFTNFNS